MQTGAIPECIIFYTVLGVAVNARRAEGEWGEAPALLSVC